MITEFEQLPFNENWNNKLSCPSFTTFRLQNARKYRVGNKLSILLKGKFLKDVEVIDVRTVKLYAVNEFVARLDTGYSRDEFIGLVTTMYKNKGIDFKTADWDLILLRTIEKRKVKPQNELFT
ncbi:MAG: hypothetical protein LCH91_13770 [Bacteroidetes bacterium]|nr:hypothetical protein [Bacteroidota bacterium]